MATTNWRKAGMTPNNVKRRPWYQTTVTTSDNDYVLWYSHHEGEVIVHDEDGHPRTALRFTYRRRTWDPVTKEQVYVDWFEYRDDNVDRPSMATALQDNLLLNAIHRLYYRAARERDAAKGGL